MPNIPKQQLQLIGKYLLDIIPYLLCFLVIEYCNVKCSFFFTGITCLVLASKMEEIYPPKIDQFANVTDGACTEEEIFSMEVTILKVSLQRNCTDAFL